MLKIFLVLVLMPLTFAFGESNLTQIDYEGYNFGIPDRRIISHDLSKLDFEVLEVQKFFIPKWIDEPGDFSDILQVKFNVTNNRLENFVVYKDMFQIDVIEPREQYQKFPRTNQDYIVDNYYPHYIEDFKLRFQDIALPQSLFECELLNYSLKINQTRTLSVCFDVKQKWSNHPLDLNGPRLYYVVMMDNKFTSSCLNCKFVLLNEYYKNPIIKLDLAPRVQISLGVPLDEISCKEGLYLVLKKSGNPACFKPSSIEKLIGRGWTISEEIKLEIFEKLAEDGKSGLIIEKTKLRLNDITTSRFNGGMPIGFSGNLSTESEFVPNAEILIISDGPCPTNGIISKGITDKFGRYHIFTEAMIWDPSDNSIKIHAEYLGNEIYLPSSSQEEVIVVYPTKDTKSC